MNLTIPYSSNALPYLGFGLGLRPEHYEEILQQKPAVEWFEIITENYLIEGGKPLYYLDEIRKDYPIVMHGVSLSIGSSDPLDSNYLKQLKTLAERIEPCWISDHLCWTGINNINLHDLLPLPYTQEAIEHLVGRIHYVQEYLQRPILIENLSSYLSFKQSEMPEWEFLSAIVKQSGCYLLCDINNIYVSAINHNFNPLDYLYALPANRIAQIHLAGHSQEGAYIIDTHDAAIISPVWDLYATAIEHFGLISTMIERDDKIPPLAELLIELNHAKALAQSNLALGVL